MRKSIVKVIFKESGNYDYASTVNEIFERYSSDELGCVIGTVMNNMSKNSGFYENSKVKFVRITSASVLEEHLPENALSAIL